MIQTITKTEFSDLIQRYCPGSTFTVKNKDFWSVISCYAPKGFCFVAQQWNDFVSIENNGHKLSIMRHNKPLPEMAEIILPFLARGLKRCQDENCIFCS